jgi:hydroxymethylglutaryl-CoA reductase (NADPH)
MNLRSYQSAKERKEALETELKADLTTIGAAQMDEESSAHCENMIGAVSIPMGVAGPLKLSGEHANGEFYIPLATTEGALVASISRGAKAITEAGGATVLAYEIGTTRGPVFHTGSIKKSKELFTWINSNEEKIRQAAESTSNHLKYKKVNVKSIGAYVFMRFYFKTDEAMGMNMATIATQKITELIEEETGIACLTVAGNYDIDKKPAWLNVINCRGKEAWAEAIIPASIVKETLKTTPQEIFDVWLAKCMLGSAMSGSMGFNCHFANVIAALYLATGQDAAHVVEGSAGITTTKVLENGDLYISVFLPAVLVGTVGGGTKLKTQTEARSIMKITTSIQLAEVTAGAVLAGELSLLASLAAQSLSESHKKLGR